jgi:hypothetical protein
MTRTGELAGVSESSRRIDGQGAEGRAAELGKRSINTSRSGIARVDGNAARECKSARPGASTGSASDQGKVAMGRGEGAGTRPSFNGANGMSDMAGKAAR